MFYDRFLELCTRKGVAPTRAAIEAGISKSLVSKWKANEAKEPSPEIIRKLADYFGVSNYEIIEDFPNNEKTPTLTKKDERDIARQLESIMQEMTNGGDLMFDGNPMSEEAIESIMAAMKLGLEAAKMKNKERFTPKKYREE